jgi:DNA-binding transcriptional LysR family regulator
MFEQQVGTALFVRHPDGVELTHAGVLVADYVRRMLVDYDSLRADLDDIRGTSRRLVRLAVVESIAASGPMHALRKFNESFPSVSFNVRLMPAPLVVETVRQGQCEVGLTYCMQPDPEIITLASIPEPIMAAVHPNHPLASVAGLRLEQLLDVQLALPDLDFGVRRIIDKAAASLAVRLNPALSSNDFETLRAFARSGLGVALLPMRAIERDATGGLKAVALEGAPFQEASVDIIVLRSRRLPRVLRAFINDLMGELGVGPASRLPG